MAMEVDQSGRASPCVAVGRRCEWQGKAEPASDTEASGTEVAPHLTAVDKVSVASSECHACLPEEALRQGYVAVTARWAVVVRTTRKWRMRWTLQPLRP